jgi:hypothetical protein
VVDVTAPSILSSSPAMGSMSVPTDATVTVNFSEAVDPSSVTIMLTPNVMLEPASLTADSLSVNVKPTAALMPSTKYTVLVSARDLAGNALTDPTSFEFTTAVPPDTTPPTVVSTVPMANAMSVSLDAGITVTFSEPMTQSSVELQVNAGAVRFGVPTFNAANTIATWTQPPLPDGGAVLLAADTNFTATVRGSDAVNNAMAMPFVFQFRTQSPPDVTPPTIVSVVPQDAATNVPGNTNINIVFSEPMNTASVANKILVGGAVRPGTYSWSSGNRVLSFKPTNYFTGPTTVSFANPLPTDVAGNPIGNWTISFSVAGLDFAGPAVSAVLPANAANDVSPTTPSFFGFITNTSVRVTFSEPMDKVATEAAFKLTNITKLLPVDGTFSWDSPTTLEFRPNTPFNHETRFDVAVSSAATDLSGNALAQFSSTFTTMRLLTSVLGPSVTNSGWMTPTSLTTQTLRVGDNALNEEIRSFVAMSTNFPAMNKLTRAELLFRQSGINGSPFASTQGAVIAELVNVGPSLETADFAAPAIGRTFIFRITFSCQLTNSPAPGSRSCDVTEMVNHFRTSPNASEFRFRLRFAGMTPVLANGVADAVFFDTNTDKANLSPVLRIQYELP